VPALDALAQQQGADLQQWPADLSEPAPWPLRVQAWLGAQDPAQLESATLINNAGVIGRLGPLDPAWPDDVATAIRVDLEAPLQLSAAFLTATRNWPLPEEDPQYLVRAGPPCDGRFRTVLRRQGRHGPFHALRGAGRGAPAAWRADRVTGAGCDRYRTCRRRCAPGIPAVFPEHGNFVALQQKGVLSSPEEAASRVLAYLARSDFGSQPIADVRDA
jgi:benzil reductase ((S)-benzoin forming)